MLNETAGQALSMNVLPQMLCRRFLESLPSRVSFQLPSMPAVLFSNSSLYTPLPQPCALKCPASRTTYLCFQGAVEGIPVKSPSKAN